jgi:hypothetical protein
MSGPSENNDVMATQTTTRSSISADVRAQARVFTILWAVAHLGDTVRNGDPGDPLAWVVLVAALLVLEKPTSRARLALLAGGQLVYLGTLLPVVFNHSVIMGCVNLGILASIAISVGRDDGSADGYPPAGALPYARLLLLVAYGSAAVAKLNEGFFDATGSCAVSVFHDALDVFGDAAPHLSSTTESVLPFVVAGAELAVPLLLLIPATRLIGVAFTIAFHMVMTLSPTAPGLGFTIVLMALVFLFLPARGASHLEDRVRTAFARLPVVTTLSRTTGFIILAVLVAMAMLFASLVANWPVLAPVVIIVGALLLDCTWQAWRHKWPRSTPMNPRHVAYFLILGLAVLNAASPYLGGKTTGSFTMFSNLQTEDHTSNHFFLPRLSLASGQDDLVRVIDSSNDRLRRSGERGFLIVWHELRRALSDDPAASIRYERGGEVFDYEHARENHDLVTLDPIGSRLLSYRRVDLERHRCLW